MNVQEEDSLNRDQERDQLLAHQEEPEVAMQQNVSLSDAPTDEKKKKVIIWGSIGAGIVAIIALIVILVLVLGGKGIELIPDEAQVYEVTEQKMGASTAKFVIKQNEDLMFVKKKADTVDLTLEDDETLCINAAVGEMCATDSNPFIEYLDVEMSILDTNAGRVTIRDANSSRWEMTDLGFFPDRDPNKMFLLESLGFKYDMQPFGFQFGRNVTGEVYFNNMLRSLVMMDQYLEIGFTLPTQDLMGMGQHNTEFIVKEGNYTIFNRDRPGSTYANGTGEMSMYGTHPFLMARTEDDNFIGMFFANSNLQQFQVMHSKSGKSIVNWRSTGGIFDIYFFFGTTTDKVIQQYQQIVGKPVLPPFWALGFHQCSWDHRTLADLQEAEEGYTNDGFPIDTMWADIDYMDKYIDFTVDETEWAGLGDYVRRIQTEKNMRFVPIIDAGISIEKATSGKDYYTEGTEQNVFIKSQQNKDKRDGNLIAQVWPGLTAFVDFLADGADEYWSAGLADLFEMVPYDGIWLDMNEPANFCDGGECPTANPPPASLDQESTRLLGESENKYSASSVAWWPLHEKDQDGNYLDQIEDPSAKTISLDAQHQDYPKNKELELWNTHSAFGTLETRSTRKHLDTQSDQDRPFILSRATIAGHGQYGHNWLGDNAATFDQLKGSIPQILDMSMFGIPFTGSDVCGFIPEDDNPILCVRWTQLGAFYPFFRNHYAKDGLQHEFWRPIYDTWREGMKTSVLQRYSLIRFMYTKLRKQEIDGTPTLRAVFFDHPEDEDARGIEDAFMWGNELRVNIFVDGQADPGQWMSYFPEGRYLDLYTFEVVESKEGGEEKELYSGFDRSTIHQVEGTIIPIQDTTDVLTTVDMNAKPISLSIFPKKDNGTAQGEIFIAEGTKQVELNKFFRLEHSKKNLRIVQTDGWRDDDLDTTKAYSELDEVKIYLDGLSAANDFFACGFDENMNQVKIEAEVHQPDGNKIGYLSLKVDKADPEAKALYFDKIQRISYGDRAANDFNYCSKTYKVEEITQQDSLVVLKISKDQTLLDVTVSTEYGSNTVRVTVDEHSTEDKPNTRFHVPYAPEPEDGAVVQNIEEFVKYAAKDQDFFLTIHGNGKDANEYFKIDSDSLIFDSHYVEVDTWVNTNLETEVVYGLGQRASNFKIDEGIYTTWARDIPSPLENGKTPGNNDYGAHPVMYAKATFPEATDPSYFGIYHHNANAQDVRLTKVETGTSVKHMISGTGVLDFYLMLDHPNPESTVLEYQKLLGRPLIAPLWGLGWHQCKYGYESTDKLRDVVEAYKEKLFPLDVMWSDIEYMERWRDFTYAKNDSYKGLDIFIDDLHAQRMKYVPIIDGGIAIVQEEYEALEAGLKDNIFIKSGNPDRDDSKNVIKDLNNTLYGQVWPGFAAFPDWTHPKAGEYWRRQLDLFHDEIAFDGLWLDMQEVANFCVGPCIPEDTLPFEESLKSQIIYTPGQSDLEEHSISIDGLHEDGHSELDYHSLFGHMQGKESHEWFVEQEKRPFMISRSTFAGSGKWISNWLGDNHATFEYLKRSIAGIMQFNIFQIPIVGADICGFMETTWDDLCEKWTVVGAFYPFSRNHNALGEASQEPPLYPEAIRNNMKQAVQMKYSLLRYYYTELWKVSSPDHNVATFFKPMFFEFPEDPETKNDIERNIMLGESLKLSPMINPENNENEEFYFPAGQWCNIFKGKCEAGGTSVSLNTKRDHLNLHLRAGHIIPFQRAAEFNILKTYDLKDVHTDLYINLDTEKKANGWIRFDDGESVPDLQNNMPSIEASVTAEVRDGSLFIKMTPTARYEADTIFDEYTTLSEIYVLGATAAGVNAPDSCVTSVTDGQADCVTSFDAEQDMLKLKFRLVKNYNNVETIEVKLQ